MFDIAFTSDAPEQQPEGWVGLWGRTQLGDCAEDFLAPLGHWQRADYERQWIEAAPGYSARPRVRPSSPRLSGSGGQCGAEGDEASCMKNCSSPSGWKG